MKARKYRESYVSLLSILRFWPYPKTWLPGPYRETSGWTVGSPWLSCAGNPLSAPSSMLSFAVPVKMPGLYAESTWSPKGEGHL